MSSRLSPHDIDAYERDGVVLVKEAVSLDWLAALDAIVERIVSVPGRWATDTRDQGVDQGRAIDERYLWRDEPSVRRFVLDSGVAALVGETMNCRTLRFYYDHWFVKERGSMTATPWHQDAPYWPFTGKQIASMWIALSDVDRESSGLELVKGSHLWNQRFRARRFVATDPKDAWIDKGDPSDVEVPDIERERDRHDIFSEPMKRGDGLIFSAWMVHAAPANYTAIRRAALSTRWLGDDVRWQPHPGADPTVGPADTKLQPGELVTDDERFPVAWTRADAGG